MTEVSENEQGIKKETVESEPSQLAEASRMTTGRRAGRRGRKPTKVDVRGRLERSRQSARECRARKKLRYQYLEELVTSREKAIYTLRKELENLRQSCVTLDRGKLAPELYQRLEVEYQRGMLSNKDMVVPRTRDWCKLTGDSSDESQDPEQVLPPLPYKSSPQQVLPPTHSKMSPQQVLPPTHSKMSPKQVLPPTQSKMSPKQVLPPTQSKMSPQQVLPPGLSPQTIPKKLTSPSVTHRDYHGKGKGLGKMSRKRTLSDNTNITNLNEGVAQVAMSGISGQTVLLATCPGVEMSVSMTTGSPVAMATVSPIATGSPFAMDTPALDTSYIDNHRESMDSLPSDTVVGGCHDNMIQYNSQNKDSLAPYQSEFKTIDTSVLFSDTSSVESSKSFMLAPSTDHATELALSDLEEIDIDDLMDIIQNEAQS